MWTRRNLRTLSLFAFATVSFAYTLSSPGVAIVRNAPPPPKHKHPVVEEARQGQTTTQARHDTLPLTVDGSKTPELIPDHVAYGHFIAAVATPAAASSDVVARREGYLARVKLSDRDKAGLLSSLRNVREQLDDIQQRRRQGSRERPLTPAALRALKSEENETVRQVRSRIRSSMTPDGRATVENFLNNHVKRRTRIYGTIAN
jgi:hypothetical protein